MFRPFAACIAALAMTAVAQGQGTKTPKPSGRPASKPAPASSIEPGSLPPVAPVELSPDVFKGNAVGLSMHLPAGVQTQSTGYGDQSTQVVGPNQAWLINIKTATTKSNRPAKEIAEEVRDQLLAMASPMEKARDQKLGNGPSKARVLQDIKELVIKTEHAEHARPAYSFYVSIPRGEKEPPVMRGYTIFEVGPGRYISFDLVVPEPAFAAARSAYETCIGTARFEDSAAITASRGAAVERGMNFLSGLSAEDLDAACAAMKDQWFRLYRPGKEGQEEEIAYRHVRAWKGKRGELDTGRDAKHWSAQDQQDGYLVRIDARMLQEGKIIDSVGTYFMSPDRREEGWLLQMVVRDPGSRKPATWRELGARTGASMSVATDGSGESRQSQPTVPDKGYLNQVEAFLLPQLLTRAKSSAGDYGFYAYQSSSASGAVSLRRDVLAAGTEADAPWTITTRMNEDSEPQRSAFTAGGMLVRTALANGNTWLPSTLPKLVELWKAKGLPMN